MRVAITRQSRLADRLRFRRKAVGVGQQAPYVPFRHDDPHAGEQLPDRGLPHVAVIAQRQCQRLQARTKLALIPRRYRRVVGLPGACRVPSLAVEPHVVRPQHQVLDDDVDMVLQLRIGWQRRRIQRALHHPVDHDLRQLCLLVPRLGRRAPLSLTRLVHPFLLLLQPGRSPLFPLEPVDLVARLSQFLPHSLQLGHQPLNDVEQDARRSRLIQTSQFRHAPCFDHLPPLPAYPCGSCSIPLSPLPCYYHLHDHTGRRHEQRQTSQTDRRDARHPTVRPWLLGRYRAQ